MTRRTRNNPSPSGLKSLSYGPKKRGDKKTKEVVSEPTTTTTPATSSTTTTKKPAPTKKRSRANSKPTEAPPAKKRAPRSRHAKTITVESHDDEEHDADDDEAADMPMANYIPPHPSSSFHAAEKPLEEERQEAEESSSAEQSVEGHNPEITHPQQHSSDGEESHEPIDEYESHELIEGVESHEHSSEEEYMQESVERYDSHELAEEVESPRPTEADVSSELAEEDEAQEDTPVEYLSQEHHQKGSRGSTPEQRNAQPPSPAPHPSPPTIIPYIHRPHFLTPKPTSSKTKIFDVASPKPPNTEPAQIVHGGSDREIPMSSPLSRAAMNRGIDRSGSGAVENQEEREDDADSNKSISFLDPPVISDAERTSWKEQQKELRGHLDSPHTATGSSQTRRKPAANGPQSKPSTTSSSVDHTVIRASIASPPKTQFVLVLTRPDLLDTARALVQWAERDDTRRPPNPREMEALLDGFAEAQETANVTARSRSRSQPQSKSSSRSEPSSRAQPPSRAQPSSHARRNHPERKTVATPRAADRRPDGDKSYSLNHEGNSAGEASTERHSEVPEEAQPPQTPAPKPQESRGFWSGVSAVTSIFASPLHFFDRRRNQDSPTATTNGNPEAGISATTTHATGLATDPLTPHRPSRPRASQSERRRQAQSARNTRPQTERARRHQDQQPKPPIHLRGIVSPGRIAEIHRQQDRLAASRNRKRRAVVERAEAEETDTENTSTPGARVGEKRKRGTVRTPPAGPPGTFRVPSPGSSDDSSDEEETEQQASERTRYALIPVTPRKELINDDVTYASPFTSISSFQPPSALWKVPEGYQPTYKEPPSPKAKTNVAPRTSPRKTSPKKTSPTKTSPTKTSPKSKPATPSSPTKKRTKAPPVAPPQETFTFSDSDSSFKVPDNDSSDSGEDFVEQSVTVDAARNNNQAPEPSVLQSKQWTQTPPPKPRPSNAQLPQFPPQLAAAEAAKARAEKFKPKQPSSLRNVTQMSPLQIGKENLLLQGHFASSAAFAQLMADSGVSMEEWERANAMQDGWLRKADPEVLAAVNDLPDDQIAEYPLPPSLSQARLLGGQSEVEKEVERHFR